MKDNIQKLQNKIKKLRLEAKASREKQSLLLNAAQQWREIFDNINDIICMTDKSGTILRCNKSMQKYLDKPFSEILGTNVHDLFHPKEEPLNKCPIKAVNKSLKREETEISLNGRNYIAVVDPLFNVQGKYTAIVHTMIDVTDRMLLSEQLRQTNEFLYNILESSASISIISTDVKHRIMYWNKGAENIYGYQVQEVIGKSIDIIYSKDKAEQGKIRLVQEEVLLNGNEINCEVQQVTKNGKMVWVDLTTSPRMDKNNKVVGAIGIAANITQKKLAEQEKQKLEKILLQTQKMEAVGTLAGGIAHDFNNLLTIIRGNVDFMMLDIEETNPLCADLKEIRIATARAANLTRQLLLFSRKQAIEFTLLNINDVVNNLSKMLERLIGENYKISADLEPDISIINSDAGNIEQVLTNLIVNARDSMREGGTINIKTENVILKKEQCSTIAESYPGKFVRLSVSDSGTGMDKETIGHIFEPFFTTKKPGEGTGLGLSVIYGIINQHKGWIDVSSEPGKGSIFKVYFPAASTKEAQQINKEIIANELKGKGEHILVIEDEEMICRFAKRVLVNNGYVVFDAKDAKEAAEVFEKCKDGLDLVVSDIILPDKSGLQVVESFLSVKPELCVVFASGYMDDKAYWQVIQEKGYNFLQKPFGMNELLTIVKETLKKR